MSDTREQFRPDDHDNEHFLLTTVVGSYPKPKWHDRARELFDEDGAPNFDEEHPYPRDIHATAQGILVFTYAGQYDRAERAIDWALANMYVPSEGRFYFRKHRLYTKRMTLMRWCQAWMAYAIAEYVATRIADEPTHGYGIDADGIERLRAAAETP